MSASLSEMLSSSPALISRMSDEGVIVVEPLRMVFHRAWLSHLVDENRHALPPVDAA